jgi:hypothetical protein
VAYALDPVQALTQQALLVAGVFHRDAQQVVVFAGTAKLTPAPQANLMHDGCAYRRIRLTRRQRVTARRPLDSTGVMTSSNGFKNPSDWIRG